MKRTKLVLTAIFLMMMTACGQNDNALNNDSEYGDQSRDGQDFVHNDMQNVTPDWDNEAERPSDQILNTPHHVSNNSPSMGQEMDLIRQTIESETPYEAGAILYNGNTIHVTVHDKGEIKTEKERRKAQKQIKTLLNNAVPQYNIDINVKK